MSDALKALAGETVTDVATIPGTRMKVDWPRLVSGQDIILAPPPQDVLNGLLLGNGDIGVSVYGPPECITLHVGKNDIWDYRDPMDEKRPVTQKEFIARYADPTIPEVVNYLETGGDDPVNSELREAYRTPMPSSKPAGKIRFRNSALAGAECTVRLRLWDAEVTAELGRPQSTMLRTFVSYPRNLIVAQYTPSGEEQFDFELARHRDSTGLIPEGPEFGASGRDIWVRYRFPPDSANYRQGFEYVMYGRVVGGQEVCTETNSEASTISQRVWRSTPETIEGQAVAHVRSANTVMLLVAIVTTRDDPHPFMRAKHEVDEAERAGFAKLIREHQDEWHNYWRRSFIQLSAKPFLTKQWFFSHYLLACCWRSGKIAPGLFGPWAWEDCPGWGNDYHWDYNMQQAVWGAYSSNHLEQTVAYNETALALLPTAKTDAREAYGLDGAKFFLSTYPRKYAHNPFPVIHYDRMMSINVWVAHPMWWYYLYSQDKDYLRTQAYPLMRECATFYEGYLTLASDGKYDIWPTAAWDIPLSPHLRYNKNCTMDLAFIRYLMKACIAASEALAVDADKRSAWQDIAENLREYPTADITEDSKPLNMRAAGAAPAHTPAGASEGRVFVTFEGMPVIQYNCPLPTTVVFPGDDIGLHSPKSIREIAWRTVQITPFYLWDDLIMLTMQRLRLGSDELDLFEKNTRQIRLPNGGLVIAGWRRNIWINGCGWPIVINESVLQSYTGQLRVAPVKLKNGVCFGQLRTVGAFLVSGEIRPGGQVAYIAITSEAGKPCSLIRPWEGDVRVRELSSMRPVLVTEAGGVLSFRTEKGSTYIVDRPIDQWEQQPLHIVSASEASLEPM